ncbi:gametocyte-specific factor 1-like [Hyla sarda]|uniref:gametocyte-specific factor 1-like n=1 Tax=Hyla sarda TaxID=327740 RepID=UPI0024C28A01|nr:gametocyte-specific factor 1-like [Hyla sarda]XP_056418759.1 gametocyte-specific factor 1-like [Hyla sarda]
MDYVICPYNAEHKVHGTELRMHLLTCQSNSVIEKPACPQPVTKKKAKWVALSLKMQEEEYQRKVEQDEQVYGPQHPDRLLQCPYDSNHQIRACRYPYHLIKCRKNHLELANQFVACPFNARHMVPRGELSFHISRCDDKSGIEKEIVDEKSTYKRDVSPSRWNAPPCNEDWDNDLQDERATFVWGTPSYQGPSTGTLMDPKNSLGSTLRAPKSLPYVLPWKMNNRA